MNATTATVLRPGADEIALAVIHRVLPAHRAGIHHHSSAELTHEAQRLEAMQPSPVVRAMRATVDAERTWRRHLERLGGRG